MSSVESFSKVMNNHELHDTPDLLVNHFTKGVAQIALCMYETFWLNTSWARRLHLITLKHE